MEIIIISRLDHYLTYKKLVSQKVISEKNKLIVISSKHKTENKIALKEKDKILDIMEDPQLPFCRNPYIALRRLRKINTQINKTKNKIIEIKATKLIGITDYFYSILLLSIFEAKGYPIELRKWSFNI